MKLRARVLQGEEVFDKAGAAKFMIVGEKFVDELIQKEMIRYSKLGEAKGSPVRITKSACLEFLEHWERNPELGRTG